MTHKFSDVAYRLEGQPMFEILAKVKRMEREGNHIIHFEIGDPDFDTPSNIVDAACMALRMGDTHYASSRGLYAFRELICETTLKSRGFKPDVEQVLITPGANIIIYYAISCLANPGDEVIVPDPGFPTYYAALKYCGVTPVRITLKEENEFRMNPADVRNAITDKTRLIIMNSPQNPTGAVMTVEEVAEMANIAEEHNLYLYSDEIYVRMNFEDDKKFSSPSFKDSCKKYTIIANGFSKSFSMTGWRLGVVIASEALIERMSLLLQTTSSCVSPFIQKAGMEAIQGDQSTVYHMMKVYQNRRDLMVSGLNDISGISCLMPGGAFYVFPNIKGTGLTSDEFSDLMLSSGKVAVLPGNSFGEAGEGYVRLCYAISEDEIKEGLFRIKQTLAQRGCV